MTHLHALAMRTAAAQFCYDNEVGLHRTLGYVIGPFEHGEHSGTHPGMAYRAAILALPIEADHAALVREAARLPEIAALIGAVKHEVARSRRHLAASTLAALSALETP